MGTAQLVIRALLEPEWRPQWFLPFIFFGLAALLASGAYAVSALRGIELQKRTLNKIALVGLMIIIPGAVLLYGVHVLIFIAVLLFFASLGVQYWKWVPPSKRIRYILWTAALLVLVVWVIMMQMKIVI